MTNIYNKTNLITCTIVEIILFLYFKDAQHFSKIYHGTKLPVLKIRRHNIHWFSPTHY